MTNKYTATQAWIHLLRNIAEKGEITNSRIGSVIEFLANSVSFDMNYPIIIHDFRKMNYRFLGAECYFICSGDNRTENLAKYNAQIRQYSDDSHILNGAYGPAFNFQLEYIVNSLSSDISSRQAVCTIWKPNPVRSKDIRCTVSLQWLIRNNKLHCFVNMRSSDVIWGVCYDFTLFTFMTIRVLTLLNKQIDQPVDLGNLYFTAASSHLYNRHIPLSKTILESSSEDNYANWQLPSKVTENWNNAVEFLRDLMKNGVKAL